MATALISGITSAAAAPAGPSEPAAGLDLPVGPTGPLPPPLVTNPDRAEKGIYQPI
jgi:hypothetical protein